MNSVGQYAFKYTSTTKQRPFPKSPETQEKRIKQTPERQPSYLSLTNRHRNGQSILSWTKGQFFKTGSLQKAARYFIRFKPICFWSCAPVCEEVPHPLCVSFSRLQIQNLLVGSWLEQTVCLCVWALPVFIPWSNIFFAAQLAELLKVASAMPESLIEHTEGFLA